MKKSDSGGAPKGRRRKSDEPKEAVADEPVADTRPALVAVPAPAEPESDAARGFDPLGEFFVSEAERARISDSYSGEGKVSAPASRTVLELLAFWVADEEYALPIVDIQEIIKVPVVTELPRAHSAVLGIVSLRGTIVPIVDLRRLLRLAEGQVTRQTRILVARADGDPVGLLVDRVTSVVRLEEDKLEVTPRTMQRQASDLVRGVGRIGQRLIIILDAGSVVSVMDRAA